MVIAFFFINRIVAFVLAPMRQALPPGTALIYTRPTEAFSLYVNIALIFGKAIFLNCERNSIGGRNALNL